MKYDVCVCDMCKKDSGDLSCFMETGIEIPIHIREVSTDQPGNMRTVVDYDEFDICTDCLRKILDNKEVQNMIKELKK